MLENENLFLKKKKKIKCKDIFFVRVNLHI